MVQNKTYNANSVFTMLLQLFVSLCTWYGLGYSTLTIIILIGENVGFIFMAIYLHAESIGIGNAIALLKNSAKTASKMTPAARQALAVEILEMAMNAYNEAEDKIQEKMMKAKATIKEVCEQVIAGAGIVANAAAGTKVGTVAGAVVTGASIVAGTIDQVPTGAPPTKAPA